MNGNGTIESPYLITTIADLNSMRDNLSSYYQLSNDIDFLGQNFSPIGDTKAWTGSFDGNGFTIKNVNVLMGASNHGFFGNTSYGTIKNIKFDNITSTFTSTSGVSSYGLLANNFIGTLSNIHIKGVLNGSGGIGRLGGVVGLTYETVDRLHANNIYSEIELKLTNVTPYSSSNKNIGGVFGYILNANENSGNISNIVANNKLTLTNPSSFNVGRLVGNRNYNDIPYTNVYVNTSSFNNTYVEPFQIVTNGTIKNPLTLDSDYWIQPSNEIPSLKSFYKVPSGKQLTESLDVPYLVSSVLSDVVKSKYVTSIPVNFKTSTVTVNKSLNSTKNIDSTIYTVNAVISNAQKLKYTIDIDVNSFEVKNNISKYKLIKPLIPFNPFNVTVNVIYPERNKPIYASVYVIENNSSTYTKSNNSYCEVI